MKQMITKLKEHKKWIIVLLLILLILLFHQWLIESVWIAGTYTNNVSTEKEISQQLKPKRWYTQSFYCSGEKLRKMNLYFTNCTDNMGKIVVELRDKNGKKIKKKERQIVASASGAYTFSFNVKKDLRIGSKYVIRVKYLPVGDEQGPSLNCYSTPSPFSNLRFKSDKLGMRMCIKYYYSKRISGVALIGMILLLLLSVVVVRYRRDIKVNYYIFSEILLLLGSIGAYLLIELISESIQYVTWAGVLANAIPIYVFANLLLVVVRNVKVVMSITLVIALFISSLNHYVVGFRDKPIMLNDILAIRTAASVADGYEFKGYCYILLGILIVSCFILLMRWFIIEEEKKKKRWYNIIKIVLLVVVFMKVSWPKLYVYYWDIVDSYQKQGMIAGVISYAKNEAYTKPEGYSSEECERLLAEATPVASSVTTKAQNIIVIMNESLSDMRIINSEKVPSDLTPFMDSMTDNVIKGQLYVPVFGAGTANPEFEVLTGISTAYVKGMPYQSLVHNDLEGMCSFFGDNGYETNAFHPCWANNWSRKSVYQYMGFQDMLFLEDLKEKELIRTHVSDSYDYRCVIDDYGKKQTDNYFMFNVTIQNHGGYTDDFNKGFEATVDLSSVGNFEGTENYLSLLKESDKAFEELITYFSKVEEPTLICMFGDHQAQIEDSYYEYLYGKTLAELTPEEAQKRYITPFIIWTNYDIEEAVVEKISSNYLSALVLQTAGYELNGYEAFLYHLYEKYPVLTPVGVYDREGVYYQSVDGIQDTMLSDYEKLQYYRIKGN